MIEKKYTCLEIQEILTEKGDLYSDEEFIELCSLFAKPVDKEEVIKLCMLEDEFETWIEETTNHLYKKIIGAMDFYARQQVYQDREQKKLAEDKK